MKTEDKKSYLTIFKHKTKGKNLQVKTIGNMKYASKAF